MNYLQTIKSNWQTITLVTLSVVVLSLVLSIVQPLQYRSRVEFLIIQKQTLTLDAYAAARASEKLANNLATVIKTKSFFGNVMTTNFDVKRSNFPAEEKELRTAWQKKLKSTVSPETSLLRVDVFDKDKKEADKIASAIGYVLVNESADYHGGGQDVVIKVVNEPLASDYPVKPNIILNTLTGLVVGLILSLGWVFYRTHQEVKKLITEVEKVEKNKTEIYQYQNGLAPAWLKKEQESVFQPQIHTMYDHLSLKH